MSNQNNLLTKSPTQKYFISLSIGLLVVFIAVAWLFSFQQNLWKGEAAQLSGLSLSALTIYQWLAGSVENPFFVPADRVPVLSYWFGLVWKQIFGLAPIALRWMSLFLWCQLYCY